MIKAILTTRLRELALLRFEAVLIGCVLALLLLGSCGPLFIIPPSFQSVQRFSIGEDGGWGQITLDSDHHRLYVPRTNRVQVIDTRSGKVLGTAALHHDASACVHAVAVNLSLNRGYTADGNAKTVTVFDLKSFATLGTIHVGENPVGILCDPKTDRVFVFDSHGPNAWVFDGEIDPSKPSPVATIDLKGKSQASVSDGDGSIFVTLPDRNQIARIDAETLKVTARWPVAPGEEPAGLAYDDERHQLFATCQNQRMVILDCKSGKVGGWVKTGKAPGAAAYDSGKHMAYCANADGTVTRVWGFGEATPDEFRVIDWNTIQIPIGSREMALDDQTHQLFIPSAEIHSSPADSDHSAAVVVPGSFKILIVDVIGGSDY